MPSIISHSGSLSSQWEADKKKNQKVSHPHQQQENSKTKQENESLMRTAMKNHFKILSLQQDSNEADGALKYLSEKLQQTRQMLQESERKLSETKEAQQDVEATRSISPQASAPFTPTLLKNDEEMKRLKAEIKKLAEANSKLTKKNGSL